MSPPALHPLDLVLFSWVTENKSLPFSCNIPADIWRALSFSVFPLSCAATNLGAWLSHKSNNDRWHHHLPSKNSTQPQYGHEQPQGLIRGNIDHVPPQPSLQDNHIKVPLPFFIRPLSTLLPFSEPAPVWLPHSESVVPRIGYSSLEKVWPAWSKVESLLIVTWKLLLTHPKIMCIFFVAIAFC